jgi:nucleotidyltransferase/DNA polymerase involved in DNA repair
MNARIIAHLDMDAFFAAVEERDNPALKGRPIAVGSDPRGGRGRGVVATANYRAREYGLRSALPITQAWRLSEEARHRGQPAVVFLPPRFERYVQVSGEIVDIVRSRAALVERAGLDEMYFDLSECGSFERAAALSRGIKAEIRRLTGLTASVGIGPNKVVAKIASDRQKPDGLTVVPPGEAERFLDPLSVRKLPGVGPKTEAALNEAGVRTVAQLKSMPREALEKLVGSWAGGLLEMARGLDDSPLEESAEVKSVSEQETFQEDTLDEDFISARLRGMAESVFERVKAEGFQGFRTVVLVIRFADFETRTKAFTLKNPLFSAAELATVVVTLLRPFLDGRLNPGMKKVRLVGVRVQKFVTAEPGGLLC